MEPLAFYYTSIKWIKQNAPEYKEYWEKFFVPFPEQTDILKIDGMKCQVVTSNSEHSFSPLLTTSDEGGRATYFVEELTKNVEKAILLSANLYK